MSRLGPFDDNAPTLLMCGVRPVLLETRARLLERAGYSVRLADGAHEATDRLLECRYRMLLICHSIQERERAVLNLAAAKANLATYLIEPLTSPEALIDEVERVLQRNGASGAASPEFPAH